MRLETKKDPLATEIYLKQRTKAWHDWRFEHIGSSDAGIIIGDTHPMERQTVDDLLMRKITRTFPYIPPAQMKHIRRGTDMEETLSNIYHNRYHLADLYQPKIFEHEKYTFLGASLDGYFDGVILEIKSTTNFKQHMLVRNGEMPLYYYPQVQHQLLVTDAYEVRFLSFLNRHLVGDTENNFDFYRVNLAELRVKRDDQYIDRLLEKEIEFWDGLKRRHSGNQNRNQGSAQVHSAHTNRRRRVKSRI